STAPSTGNSDYGYLWWLRGNGDFRAQGIFGQDVLIDPDHRIVIALQSARADADKAGDWKLQDAFYDALIQALGE
ncbi:MAG: serine hydrolase, partial [Pseudomonadota bacterium]